MGINDLLSFCFKTRSRKHPYMMSKLLQSNTYFLRLLFHTTKKQALLLLENTTPSQSLALGEIALNLLHLPLNKKEKKEVSRHNNVLKKISKKKLPIKTRQKLISKNKKVIYSILQSIESSLFKLI